MDTTDNATVRNLPPSLVKRCSSGYSSLTSQSVDESCSAEGMYVGMLVMHLASPHDLFYISKILR